MLAIQRTKYSNDIDDSNDDINDNNSLCFIDKLSILCVTNASKYKIIFNTIC